MTIRCLHLEDDTDHFKALEQKVKLAFTGVADVEFKQALTEDEARHCLEDPHSDFQIYFVDSVLEDTWRRGAKSPSGFSTLAYAVKRPDLLIVAVTDDGSTEARLRFEELGGHMFLCKDYIKHMANDRLCLLLRQAVEARGHLVRELPLHWNTDSIRLGAVIDSIKKRNLEGLLGWIMPKEVASCEATFVAPGFSGAAVLRIDGRSAKNEISKRLLVKVSRDREKLALEVTQTPGTGDPTVTLYVRYDGLPVSFGGWHAIAASYETKAVTFEQWVMQAGRTQAETEQFLDSLFTEGLRDGYELQQRQTDVTPLALLVKQLLSRARVQASIETLAPVLRRAVPGFDTGRLLAFVQHDQIGVLSPLMIPAGTTLCMSHGDLHARNILVRGNIHAPVLIDPARRTWRHWASDPARFCAHLWMLVWGDLDGYFWDNLPLWQQQVRQWWQNRPVENVPAVHEGVYAALNYVPNHLRALFGEVHLWEFHLALALEFLAMSTYDPTPAPKRCLGLLAAHDLLESIEHTVPRVVRH